MTNPIQKPIQMTTSTTTYSNAPLFPIISRVFRQVFNRKAMGLLWKVRKTLCPGQSKMIDSLYNRTKKRTNVRCESEITYRLSSKKPGQLGYGRYQGQTGSMEALQKDIRGTLCIDDYVDVDVVNCHPVIIVQMAKNWFNMSMPALLNYVENRDSLITVMSELCDFSREETKQLIISILYGSKVKEHVLPDGSKIDMPDEILKIKKEIEDFTTSLKKVSAHEELLKYVHTQKEANPLGSFTSYIVQTEERKILEAMTHFITTKDFSVDVLAYDGVQVRIEEGKIVDDDLLRSTEEFIKEITGYKITLKIKPFETFTFEEVKEETGILEESLVIDDMYACNNFIDLMGKDIMKQDGEVYVYNKSKGMWENGKDSILSAVLALSSSLVFKQKTSNGTIHTFNYGGSIKTINNMLSCLKALLTEEEGVIKPSASKLALLFTNGWFDMKTKTFHTGFEDCRDKYFTRRIKRTFQPIRNPEFEELVKKTLFRNPYNDDTVGDFYMNGLARAIGGHVQDKVWWSIVGNPNCGKGVMTAMMKGTFDEYVGEFNMNVLKYNIRDGADEAKKLAWFSSLVGCRVAIGNEARVDGVKLDGNLIKTLSSGGDSILLRGNYQNQYTVSPLTTFFGFCNDLPPISPCDQALKNRMVSIPHTKSFVTKPQAECNQFEMESDPDLKETIETKPWIESFFWLLMDAYNGGKISKRPDAVETEINDLFVVEDDAIKSAIEESYDICLADNEAFVSSKELLIFIKEGGLKMSDVKIARELKKMGLTNCDIQVGGKKTRVWLGIKPKES